MSAFAKWTQNSENWYRARVANDNSDLGGAGAGSWALKGFDYQAAVSVWLALDVMVANKLAAEMVLEHVSEEDIEAEVEEFEPGAVADTVPMRGYRLIVQAKRREGNAWTEGQFIKLLEHLGTHQALIAC